MAAGPGEDRFDARWASIALRALLADRLKTVNGTLVFRFDSDTVRIAGSHQPTASDRTPQPTATIKGPATLLLALASGQLTLQEAKDAGVSIELMATINSPISC